MPQKNNINKKSHKAKVQAPALQPAAQTHTSPAKQTVDSEQKRILSSSEQLNEADDFIVLQATPLKGLPTSGRPSDG